MMSACNIPRVNTGHGVRATQRTNALIRLMGMAVGGHWSTVSVDTDGKRRKRALWDGRVASQHYCYLR